MIDMEKRRPWLKSYMLGPYKLAKTLEPYPMMPLNKILDDSAARYPSRDAVYYLGRLIRYSELKLHVDKLATALAELGVKKGDKVALILPNCPQFIVTDFAILKIGAVGVPCSPEHEELALQYQIGESGAETVICLEDSLDLVDSIRHKTKLKNIIITSHKDYTLEELETPNQVPGTFSFRELIAKYEPQPPEVEIDPVADLAYILYTGGTAGLAKGVMLTHYAVLVNIIQGLPWVYAPMSRGIIGSASTMICVPLFHVLGYRIMQTSIYWGLRIILMPDARDTDQIIKLMREFRPLLVVVVPTQLMRLVEKKVGRLPVMVMTGGAPLPSEVADLVEKDLLMPVSEAFGTTEMGSTHFNLTAFSKITGFAPRIKRSFGVPVPNVDIKLVDLNTGKDNNFAGDGEIFLRGPQIMKGYWPTLGSGLVDGWFPTGDIGRMDEDGYFYIVDRVKDIANISGHAVSTDEIDEVLFKHPAVSMAIAVGIPHPKHPGSERIKAFIKLKRSYEGRVTAEDIIEHCRGKCPPYAVPELVEFLDELPLTVTEKLFKRALREEETRKMKERGELK